MERLENEQSPQLQSQQSSSPTSPSLHLRHNSFSDPSVALPTSQLILRPFFRFSYVTAHSPTLLSLLLRHRPFTYVTWRAAMSRAHSPTFPLLRLRHSSFSNRSVALLPSQLILQPFRRFTYITVHSPTLLSFLLRHRLFTYVTWRAAHVIIQFVKESELSASMQKKLGHNYVINLIKGCNK